MSPQVHNVAFAFELMQDGGLKKPKARPEGILKTYIEQIKDVNLLEGMLWRLGGDLLMGDYLKRC